MKCIAAVLLVRCGCGDAAEQSRDMCKKQKNMSYFVYTNSEYVDIESRGEI